MLLSPEQTHLVASAYIDGASAAALARQYGVSHDTIAAVLRSHAIPLRTNAEVHARLRLLTPEQENTICHRFQAGTRRHILSKEFHVSQSVILACTTRRGLQNHGRFQYTVNETAFDEPMTEEKAYWIGMLMADGGIYISKRPHAQAILEMKLQRRDIQHLEKLRCFLELSRPLDFIEDTNAMRLRVTSQRLVEAIGRFGIVPQKSVHGKAYFLMDNRHFWRGMIDGDGHISIATYARKYRPRISLVGNRILMEQFATFIRQRLPMLNPGVRPLANIWQVALTGRGATQLIALLYRPCFVALERKLFRARSILEKQLYLPF